MWDWMLSILSNLISAVIAAVAACAWQQRKIRRLRSQLRALEMDRGEREVAFVVSAREDIAESVRSFLHDSGRGKMTVFQVHRPGSFSDQEGDWMAFVKEIRGRVQNIREHGATRIYLFTNAPVVMGVFAGALLDNGPQVVVHHYFNGTYRRVGTLSHETVNL